MDGGCRWLSLGHLVDGKQPDRMGLPPGDSAVMKAVPVRPARGGAAAAAADTDPVVAGVNIGLPGRRVVPFYL